MRTRLPLLVVLLTATAAQAGAEGNNYFDIQELLLASLTCCISGCIPVVFLVTLIVGVVWQRKQRLKYTDPQRFPPDLPPFPRQGA